MKRLSEHSVIDIKNRSFSVTAAVDTADGGPTNGVMIAQGGRFGGWALYVKDGRAKFVYNLLGMQEFVIEATEDLTSGSHQVRAEFAYDGGGLAKGGDRHALLRRSRRRHGPGRRDPAAGLLRGRDHRHR